MAGPHRQVVVGRHAVAEALAAAPQRCGELWLAGRKGSGLARIAELARSAGVKVRRVEKSRLDQVAGGAVHQGAALFMAAADYGDFGQLLQAAEEAGPRALVVLADHLQDPHNLGALIRSAAAAGAQGLVVPKDRCAPLSPAVGKAAAGALSLVPVCRVTNLHRALMDLKQAGLWALAAVAAGAPPPWQLDLARPLALVVGGEHQGVTPRLQKACDLAASLPLASGVESLNASVAAGALLFEIVRQRQVDD